MEFVREREKAERDERAEKLELAKTEKEALEMQLKVKVMETKGWKEQKPDMKTKFPGRVPKLPIFQDETDDLDAYLQRFERYADSQGWPEENWAVNLAALLTGT